MERAYKFRIYPDAEQEELIQKTFGCVRFVYNHYLDKRIEFYKTEAKTLGYNACSADLTEMKKQITWLKEVDSTALPNLHGSNVSYPEKQRVAATEIRQG